MSLREHQGQRVVITGVGAITPLGLTMDETWRNLLAAKSGVRPIAAFDTSDIPTKIAAEVRGFVPEDHMDRKVARRTGLFTQYSIAAANMAVENACLDLAKEDPTRIGIEIGSAVGALGVIEEQSALLREHGYRRLNPLNAPIIMINAASCQVAVLLGIKGPTNSPVAACATGTYAIGQALMHLRRGGLDVMIAGGTEGAITPVGVASFGKLGALSPRNDDPAGACRPFDVNRDGTVMGEGAAVVVLETLEHAQRRGAPILAEAVGYGVTEDAFHMTAPNPDGEGAARAMSLALADGGLSPEEIDLIAAHGTGTPLNDVTETKSIKETFGQHAYKLAITANKSMLGHMFGAAGAISVITTVLAIRDGMIPPTINLDTPDPECDLDYVPLRARQARVDAAIANAFGFGGQNASLAVRRYVNGA